MQKLLISASLGLMLSACQTTAFETPVADFDYGEPPEYSETELKDVVGGILKDEESARYRFGEMQKAYCNTGVLSGGKVVWSGWVLPLQVNARNSYGGYNGYTSYYARYDDGALLDVSPKHDHSAWDFVPKLGTGCSLVR